MRRPIYGAGGSDQPEIAGGMLCIAEALGQTFGREQPLPVVVAVGQTLGREQSFPVVPGVGQT